LYVITATAALGSAMLLLQFARRPALRARVLLRPLMFESLSQLVRAVGLLMEMAPLIFGFEPLSKSSPTACALLGAMDQLSSVCCYGWYTAIACNAALVLAAPVERPAFTQPERRRVVVRREEIVVSLAAVLSVLPPAAQGAFGAIGDKGYYR